MQTSTQTLRMGRPEWLMLMVLSVLWGGSFFFAKVALAELGPLLLVLLRVAIAAIALGLIARMLGHRIPSSPQLWKRFFILGAINNLIPFSLLFWGQTHIGSGLASILTAIVPVFTVLVAHAATSDERITPAKSLGVGFGVLGVTVMIGLDLHSGHDWLWLGAMLACLVAALCYALATVYGRSFRACGLPPLIIAFGQVSATSVMMLPIALAVEQPWQLAMPSTATIGAVLGLGLLSTALAYVLFFRILDRGGATNLSLVTFLIPISAIALSTALLGEQLHLSHVLGMLLIFVGLAVLDGRLWRLVFRPAPIKACAQSC